MTPSNMPIRALAGPLMLAGSMLAVAATAHEKTRTEFFNSDVDYAADQGSDASTAPPPLYDGLGSTAMPISTKSTQAQSYFDPGVQVERITTGFRANAGTVEIDDWGRKTALPLVAGFAAFWRGDYETAASQLYGARHIANAFGGSHAQCDIIDWTLTEATARGGLFAMTEALAGERLALKPHSPINRSFLTRARAGAMSNIKAA